MVRGTEPFSFVYDRLLVAALAASCGFVSGIALRSFFDISYEVLFALILFSCVVAVLWRMSGNVQILYITVALLASAFGILRFDIATWDDQSPLFEERIGREVVVYGTIVQEVDERARTARLTVDVDSIDGLETKTRILVITERFPIFAYGDRIVVRGDVSLPEAFETEFDRTFNYPGYLSARNVTYTIAFADVERISTGNGNAFIETLLRVKHVFMNGIEAELPEPHAGLAQGITLGVKRALGTDLEGAFRKTGIIHIVVLSGYNVAIVAEAIMRLLSYFFVPRTRMVFGIMAICAFALIAGLSATVVRASIMASLVLIARAYGHIYSVVRALIFAGVLMLIINPKLLIFDPGFQLSFLATLGLIYLAPAIDQYCKLVPTKFQIREFLTATIAAQLFVLPLLLFLIGELSIVAVLVNVLVLPIVPFAMLFTFISGALALLVPLIAVPFAYVTYLALGYIISVVSFFATLPYASLIVPPFSFWWVVLGYSVLAVWSYRTFRQSGITTRETVL